MQTQSRTTRSIGRTSRDTPRGPDPFRASREYHRGRQRFILKGHSPLPLLLMKKLALALGLSLCASSVVSGQDVAKWEKEAANVTITRDDWGIAHVHGKTDADAVFGIIYAQAEDDFNRV